MSFPLLLRLRVLVALACMVAASASARAAPPRYVQAQTIAGPSDAAGVEEVLGELLGRLDVELRSSRADRFDVSVVVTPVEEAADEALVARVWLDVRGPQLATVYLVDRSWERVLVRDVPMAGPGDEVAREQLGHIVQAAVETLLAGGQVGRPREEVRARLGVTRAPAPAPPARPPPRAKRPAVVARRPSGEAVACEPALAAFWEVQGYASDEPVAHGPGLRFELSFLDRAWRPGLAFVAGYRLPIVTEGRLVDARLDTLVFRTRAQLEYLAADDVRIAGAVAFGFDAVHIDPRSEHAATMLAASRFTGVPVLGASLAARWYFIEALALELSAGIDGTLVDNVYFVTRGPRKQTVLDPWSARPTGTFGLVWIP